MKKNPPGAGSCHNSLTDTIVVFLREIGIQVQYGETDESSFLPGIALRQGTIIADKQRLLYPGDLLHEAGHIAIAEPGKRVEMNGGLDGEDMGHEIGAILWSYAALVHLELAPEVVFHPSGYRGQSDWFIENFTSGNYIGLPLLQWMGLCKKDTDEQPDTEPFPNMIKWLRES